MSNELVSIIMPAFNCAEMIEESIQSALSQTYKNIELIVVDDGSTDDTVEAVRKSQLNDGRMKLVFKEHGGAGAARNAGIRVSNGVFITFLDADDVWDERKIELQIDAAECHPKAVVLCEIVRFVDYGNRREISRVTSPPSFTNRAEYLRKLLNLENHEMVSWTTALVRKQDLESAGLYDENLRTSEDWDLWIRVACNVEFVNIYKPLYFYRKYSGSLTTKTKVENTLQGQLYVIQKAKKLKLIAQSDIRFAKMYKYLEFANVYWYQKMNYRLVVMLMLGILNCPEGFGKVLLKKTLKKLRRLRHLR